MATLEQERHVEIVAGAQQAFFVTSRLVAAGLPVELPHLSVFVLQVTDVLDPKADALVRVATLADLSLLPIGRDAGIAAPGAGGIVYLSPSVTMVYDTLEIALTAAQAFQDRVNQLLVDWETFTASFNAPTPLPALYTLPRTSASQRMALIEAYTTAKRDRYQAQATLATANQALASAQASYVYQQGLVASATSLRESVLAVQTDLTAGLLYYATLLTESNGFYGSNPTGAGAVPFAGALAVAATRQTAMGAYPGHATASVVAATALADARTAEVLTARTALTSAEVTQTAQAQVAVAAATLEATALAAVRAVCPDFDPASIPYVPG